MRATIHRPVPSDGSWFKWIVTTFAFLLFFTEIGVAHALDQRYGPVDLGKFDGIASNAGFTVVGDGTYRLTAESGEVMESLSNHGAHAIKVTSIDSEASVSQIRWSTYQFVPGGAVSGLDTPWQAFPALIPAHGMIRLLVTIQQPAVCRTGVKPGELMPVYTGVHTVHWDSLYRGRTNAIQLDVPNITLC